jgi:hypothetical protein
MFKQAGTYILFFFIFSSVKVNASALEYGMQGISVPIDTVPAVKAVEAQPAQQVETVEAPTVIKQVPKSRKQLKPVAVPKIVTTKPKAIIKPKIVIKTGLIR